MGKTRNAREMAYVEHADWVLIGDNVRQADPKSGRVYTRVYDCGKNRMGLLDAGPVPDGYGVGWMYDAKRRLVYAFTFRGELWALRIETESVRLLDKPDE